MHELCRFRCVRSEAVWSGSASLVTGVKPCELRKQLPKFGACGFSFSVPSAWNKGPLSLKSAFALPPALPPKTREHCQRSTFPRLGDRQSLQHTWAHRSVTHGRSRETMWLKPAQREHRASRLFFILCRADLGFRGSNGEHRSDHAASLGTEE